MFTDWSHFEATVECARYFYFHGALLGLVFASLFWCLFVPWLKSKVGR